MQTTTEPLFERLPLQPPAATRFGEAGAITVMAYDPTYTCLDHEPSTDNFYLQVVMTGPSFHKKAFRVKPQQVASDAQAPALIALTSRSGSFWIRQASARRPLILEQMSSLPDEANLQLAADVVWGRGSFYPLWASGESLPLTVILGGDLQLEIQQQTDRRITITASNFSNQTWTLRLHDETLGVIAAPADADRVPATSEIPLTGASAERFLKALGVSPDQEQIKMTERPHPSGTQPSAAPSIATLIEQFSAWVDGLMSRPPAYRFDALAAASDEKAMIFHSPEEDPFVYQISQEPALGENAFRYRLEIQGDREILKKFEGWVPTLVDSRGEHLQLSPIQDGNAISPVDVAVPLLQPISLEWEIRPGMIK